MPSVKNPNGPSKNRLAARRASVKKDRQKKSAAGKSTITKAQTKRGARPGILPTSGPGRALSAKKQKKLQRQLGYALKRKTEADGEVEMKDATESKEGKKGVTTAEEKMEVDDDIS